MNKENKIGLVLPGQRWIELNGQFTPEELRKIATDLVKKNKDVPDRKAVYDDKK